MSINDALMSRWQYNDTRLEPLKTVMTRALGVHDAVREEHERLRADPKLSALGRQDALRKFSANNLAHEMRRTNACIATARATLDEWRGRLQPPRPDPTDTAAAILRSEIRQMLRSKSLKDRIKLLTDNPDPTLLDAVLEAPDFAIGGIPDEIRRAIINASVEKAHPGQLAAIAQMEEAIELTSVTAQVTVNTVRAAAEFPNDATLNDFINGAVDPDRSARIDDQAAQEMRPLAEFAA